MGLIVFRKVGDEEHFYGVWLQPYGAAAASLRNGEVIKVAARRPMRALTMRELGRPVPVKSPVCMTFKVEFGPRHVPRLSQRPALFIQDDETDLLISEVLAEQRR